MGTLKEKQKRKLDRLFVKARTCKKEKRRLQYAGWETDNDPSDAINSGEPPVDYSRLR